MAILYYPWQEYCAVTAPWWFEFAGTVSGNFHVSWIMCCTVVLWIYETIWERWPFSEIKNERLRGYATFFGIVAIAFCCHFGFILCRSWPGDPPLWATGASGPRTGDGCTLGNHGLLLVPAMFITFYCNNWPQSLQQSNQLAYSQRYNRCGRYRPLCCLLPNRAPFSRRTAGDVAPATVSDDSYHLVYKYYAYS